MTITLPLPNKILSPNARPHWAQKARYTRAARHRAKLTALAAFANQPGPHVYQHYTLAFHFPNAIRRDDDNAAAACKAYRDGIADALKMDDHHLTMSAAPLILTDPANPRLEITLHP